MYCICLMTEVFEIRHWCLYLAVCAVRGVFMACSIVPGLPLCVPGLTNPLTGRPAWDMGLKGKHSLLRKDLSYLKWGKEILIKFSQNCPLAYCKLIILYMPGTYISYISITASFNNVQTLKFKIQRNIMLFTVNRWSCFAQ